MYLGFFLLMMFFVVNTVLAAVVVRPIAKGLNKKEKVFLFVPGNIFLQIGWGFIEGFKGWKAKREDHLDAIADEVFEELMSGKSNNLDFLAREFIADYGLIGKSLYLLEKLMETRIGQARFHREHFFEHLSKEQYEEKKAFKERLPRMLLMSGYEVNISMDGHPALKNMIRDNIGYLEREFMKKNQDPVFMHLLLSHEEIFVSVLQEAHRAEKNKTYTQEVEQELMELMVPFVHSAEKRVMELKEQELHQEKIKKTEMENKQKEYVLKLKNQLREEKAIQQKMLSEERIEESVAFFRN